MESIRNTIFSELPEDFQETSYKRFDFLRGQIISGIEIVPFIGAGVSAPFDVPIWSKFLENVLKEIKAKAPEEFICKIKNLLASYEFEKAADILYEEDPDLFEQQIRTSFDIGPNATRYLSKSIVPQIAELCNGTIITTNFDNILENVISELLKIPFELITPIGDFYKKACKALRVNKHVILKIHGNYDDKNSRVLTKRQYDANYTSTKSKGKIDFNLPLPKLIHLLSASKTILFIGCSLSREDRTLTTLIELNNSDFPHYALLEFPDDPKKASDVDDRLREAGINVIWFKLKKDSTNPYINLHKILEQFAEISNDVKIFENGKSIISPISYHSSHLYKTLKKSNTVVRHSCNRDQYIDFATRMLIDSGTLKNIIWTVNKSPSVLAKNMMDKSLLSDADKMFRDAPAIHKTRIVIFGNSKELQDYYNHRGKSDNSYASNRITSFENSIEEGNGKLLFATKQSLAAMEVEHLDIGYIQSKINEEEIVFCSNINSNKMKLKNYEFETIVFSMNGNMLISPSWSLNLKALQQVINSIIYKTFDASDAGVYSDIEKLKNWQENNDRKTS